jgi:hypothetical protein
MADLCLTQWAQVDPNLPVVFPKSSRSKSDAGGIASHALNDVHSRRQAQRLSAIDGGEIAALCDTDHKEPSAFTGDAHDFGYGAAVC